MTRTAEYLEAAADRVMIKDLLARYAWEVDHGTPEGFAAVFTEDGIFEVSALKLWVKGTAALTQFARSLQRTLPNVHHVMSNFVIDVSGDRARGCCRIQSGRGPPQYGKRQCRAQGGGTKDGRSTSYIGSRRTSAPPSPASCSACMHSGYSRY